jgi:hypothetical protein
VHDVINIFQVTGLTPEGKYFMEPSPAKKTDYLEFFAEQDVLMALSACPGGDLSAWGWGEGGAGEGGVYFGRRVTFEGLETIRATEV